MNFRAAAVKYADECCARFCYGHGVSFNAIDSQLFAECLQVTPPTPFHWKMYPIWNMYMFHTFNMQVAAKVGAQYKPPKRKRLATTLLDKE